MVRAALTCVMALAWLPLVTGGLSYGAPYWPPPGFAGELAGYIVFATLTVAVPALASSAPAVSLERFALNAGVALVALPLGLAGTDPAGGLDALAFTIVGFALPGALGVAVVCGAWILLRQRRNRKVRAR